MVHFDTDDLKSIGDAYAIHVATYGDARILRPMQLLSILKYLEISLQSESKVESFFSEYSGEKGYMTFDDLAAALLLLKEQSNAQTDTRDSELASMMDPSSQEIEMDALAAALAEVGLPTNGLEALADKQEASVRFEASLVQNASFSSEGRPPLSRKKSIAPSALLCHLDEEDSNSSGLGSSFVSVQSQSIIIPTSTAPQKVEPQDEMKTMKIDKHHFGIKVPYSAMRKSATVVSSGATSVLAGSLHAEVMHMRKLRAMNSNISNQKIQTPLPLPKFYDKRRKGVPDQFGPSTQKESSVSFLSQEQLAESMSRRKLGRRRSSATTVTSESSTALTDATFLQCSQGSTLAYTTILPVQDSDEDDDANAVATNPLVTVPQPEELKEEDIRSSSSQHFARPLTSCVSRGSLRRTHKSLPQRSQSSCSISRPSSVKPPPEIEMPATRQKTPKSVPSSRIVRRITELDKTLYNPKHKGAPATIHRLLKAIDEEASDLFFLQSDRARLKSPYSTDVMGCF